MIAAVADTDIVNHLTPAFLGPRLEEINASAAVVADTNISSEALQFLIDNCTAPLFVDTVSTAKAARLVRALQHSSSRRLHALKLNLIEAQAVIIATGATAKYLGLPSEQEFRGMGVSACATCDGFFYRKKDVAVVGGGDTACEEATYLANLCNKVYMIVRRDVFRASQAMQDKVRNTPNIEILWNCNTQEILGDASGVTGARLVRKDGKVFDIRIDGFFLAIGHHPNSDVFKEFIDTDELGYIVTSGKSSRTNVEGVFAAGDVQDPSFRQAITAAASGCKAALEVEKFLLSH
jgi:thioredoxin reductase (NADPH)